MTQKRSDADRTRSKDNSAALETKHMERPPMDRWSPASTLVTPSNTGEYRYRWVAEFVNGTPTPRNVQKAIQEKYQRVLISDLPDDFIVDEDNGDGFARTGGLILMRIPEEYAQMREQYYLSRSNHSLRGANELQGIAGSNTVEEDRGTRALNGAEAGAALASMSQQI